MTQASAPSVPLPISDVHAMSGRRGSASVHREATSSRDSDPPVDAPSIDTDGFRQGDPDCCRRVLDEFSPLIWSVVFSYVRERAECEDVYQEICVRVWERSGQYSGRGSLAGWINKIAHRHCINWRKRQRTYHSYQKRYAFETAALAEFAHSSEDPALLAERREFGSRVTAALATLPEKQSETFILVRLRGCETREAARILGVQPATVRSNLRHATRKLRRELKEFEHGLS